MKIHITSKIKIRTSELKEVTDLVPVTIDIKHTNKKLKVIDTPFGFLGIDFSWIRQITPNGYDIRALVTSKTDLINNDVIGHIGLYDNLDNDKTTDVYFGVPYNLDSRAKKNGFKTNFAWLLTHEICHGLAHMLGEKDILNIVHDAEKKGELKTLLTELHYRYMQKKDNLKTQVSLLQKLLNLLNIMQKRAQYPIDKESFLNGVTQGWLVKNNLYKSGYHNGLDVKVPILTQIKAIADGRIYHSAVSPQLGHFCFFECEIDGRMTYHVFPHLDKQPYVGDYKKGDIIGRIGDTGLSFGSHLHWTVLIEKPETVADYVALVDTREKIMSNTLDPYKFILYAVDKKII